MALNTSENKANDSAWLARMRKKIDIEDDTADAIRNQMSPEQLREEARLDGWYSDKGDV